MFLMDIFSALAEPTRRSIIEMLAERGQLTASNICDKFNVSAPAISQHLKVLREANLVTMEKRAQQHIYQINPKAKDWIKKMMMLWNESFEKLEEVIKND